MKPQGRRSAKDVNQARREAHGTAIGTPEARLEIAREAERRNRSVWGMGLSPMLNAQVKVGTDIPRREGDELLRRDHARLRAQVEAEARDIANDPRVIADRVLKAYDQLTFAEKVALEMARLQETQT